MKRKVVSALVRRLWGAKKGKVYRRYFRTDAEKQKVIEAMRKRIAIQKKTIGEPKKGGELMDTYELLKRK